MTTYMVRIIERDTGKERFVKTTAKNRTEAHKKVDRKLGRMFYNVNGAYTIIEHARLYFKHNCGWILKPGEHETDWDRLRPYVRERAKKLAMESVRPL